MYPPGGTRPFGLCGETVFATAAGAAGSSETITPGQPINSPVNGLTGKMKQDN